MPEPHGRRLAPAFCSRYLAALVFLLSIAISSLLFPASAQAAGLDIRGWLDRPGVKLLAVEFYATWCKPCMEAVPRWKALHEKYRKDGLRLVVVATQDPEAGCVNPGWSPDDVICDDDGSLAKLMGAGNRLPAAFLWSWQGNLLARQGHVDEVEASIEQWMRSAPRVDVRVLEVPKGSGVDRAELRGLIRSEIGRSAKLTVVASQAERNRLAKLKRDGYSERFDDKSRCEIGKELSPNSMLDVSVLGSRERKRLRLGLLSVEQGCLIGSALVDWNRARPEVSVAEGVAELAQKLRPAIQMPRGSSISFGPNFRRRASFEEDIGERAEEWAPEGAGARVIATFSSTPPGAVVLLNGELLCQDTSKGCSRAIRKGTYTVTMQRERYKKRSQRLVIDESTEVKWALKPDFALLSIASEPPGLEVKVDGKAVGKTPMDALAVDKGRREIMVSDRCYYDRGKRMVLGEGDIRNLSFKMKPRMGAIDIVATDGSGNAKRGELWIDDQRVGMVPGVHKVAVCAQTVEVRKRGVVLYTGPAEIKEKQLVHLRAVLNTPAPSPSPTPPPAEAPSPTGLPALIYLDPRHVDFRTDASDSEGPGLRDALSQAGQSLEAFKTFRGREFVPLLRPGQTVVIPDLEKGQPRLDRASKRALQQHVKAGGRLVVVLDEAGKDRATATLNKVFGWRLKTRSSPSGSASTLTPEARGIGFFGPATLPHNNDCDALEAGSLPPGGVVVFADARGDATVSTIAYGAGQIWILGWDWYDAAPRGKQDGGWNTVLGLALKYRRRVPAAAQARTTPAPSPARPASRTLSPPPRVAGPPRGKVLFMNEPRFVDVRPGAMDSEGAAIEATLTQFGHPLSYAYLGGLRSAYDRHANFRAVVIPELEWGDLRLIHRAVGSGRKHLRKYVAAGGTLVTFIDGPRASRVGQVAHTVFGIRGLEGVPASGPGQLSIYDASAMGLTGLPATLPPQPETHALLRRTLPKGTRVLYADEAGHAMVAVIPYRRGNIVALGWDWQGASPLGRVDGGWLTLLERILR